MNQIANILNNINELDNDKELKNQIVGWIQEILENMDEFIEEEPSIKDKREKVERVEEFFSSLVVVSDVLTGKKMFYGNKIN